MKRDGFVSNLLVAFGAQGISMVLSVLTSFIVPKMLGVEEFSYWQLFIFYVSYVGIFHFGLDDGVYLKYGGKSVEEMDCELLSGQFRILIMLEVVLAAVLLGVVLIIDVGTSRLFVFAGAVAYMLFANTGLYIGYVFQAANKTKLYSYSVIVDKLVFMVLMVGLFAARVDCFQPYVVAYLIGKILCSTYCYYMGRSLVFCKVGQWDRVWIEFYDSVRAGIKLTISSMSSMFILGCGRALLDSVWGITVFGKVSFALSLSSFALAFIAQISMVLFPYLRRKNDIELISIYGTMRSLLLVSLPAIYVAYVPAKLLLLSWLPQYAESLTFLGVLLPICLFDAKMNLICNTYFKVLRGEGELLRINLLSVAVSLTSALVGAYILKSYWAIILSMVGAVAFRSVFAEYRLGKRIGVFDLSVAVQEVAVSCVFCLSSLLLSDLQAFLLASASYVALLVFNRAKVVQVRKIARSMR